MDRINALRTFHNLAAYQPTALDNATMLSDMLRHKIPFPTGQNHKAEPHGPTTCMALPNVKRFSNPNISN